MYTNFKKFYNEGERTEQLENLTYLYNGFHHW